MQLPARYYHPRRGRPWAAVPDGWPVWQPVPEGADWRQPSLLPGPPACLQYPLQGVVLHTRAHLSCPPELGGGSPLLPASLPVSSWLNPGQQALGSPVRYVGRIPFHIRHLAGGWPPLVTFDHRSGSNPASPLPVGAVFQVPPRGAVAFRPVGMRGGFAPPPCLCSQLLARALQSCQTLRHSTLPSGFQSTLFSGPLCSGVAVLVWPGIQARLAVPFAYRWVDRAHLPLMPQSPDRSLRYWQ